MVHISYKVDELTVIVGYTYLVLWEVVGEAMNIGDGKRLLL